MTSYIPSSPSTLSISWCRIDKHKFLVGDVIGRLAMLVYTPPSGLTLLPLGEVSSSLIDIQSLAHSLFQTSPASAFTYLTSQVVYVGSCLADSLLIRLHHTPWRDPDRPTLEIPLDITTASLETTSRPVTKDGVVIDAKGNYIEILEEYPNLAPVEDAVLVDLAGSGQVCHISHWLARGSILFSLSPRSLRVLEKVTQGV